MDYKVHQIIYHKVCKYGIILNTYEEDNKVNIYFPKLKKETLISTSFLDNYIDLDKPKDLSLTSIFHLRLHECLFDQNTISLSYSFANSLLIKNISITKNLITASAIDKLNRFKLEISYSEDSILSYSCTCFEKKPCKHLYALIILSKNKALLPAPIEKDSQINQRQYKEYLNEFKNSEYKKTNRVVVTIDKSKIQEYKNKLLEITKNYQLTENFIDKLDYLHYTLQGIKDRGFYKYVYLVVNNDNYNNLDSSNSELKEVLDLITYYDAYLYTIYLPTSDNVIKESLLTSKSNIPNFQKRLTSSLIYGYINSLNRYLKKLINAANKNNTINFSDKDKEIISASLDLFNFKEKISLLKIFSNDEKTKILDKYNKEFFKAFPANENTFKKLEYKPKFDKNLFDEFLKEEQYNKVLPIMFHYPKETYENFGNDISRFISILITASKKAYYYSTSHFEIIDFIESFPNNLYLFYVLTPNCSQIRDYLITKLKKIGKQYSYQESYNNEYNGLLEDEYDDYDYDDDYDFY